jgi:hypothetical protein
LEIRKRRALLERALLQNKNSNGHLVHKSFLTVHGRVQLANLIYYGMPRYWMQSMCPPPWFNENLIADVTKLIWDRHIEFDPEEEGSVKESRPWIRKTAIHLPRRLNKKEEGLGLGLLDWESGRATARPRGHLSIEGPRD